MKLGRDKAQKLSPFEDWLDLATFVRLRRGGYTIGAYLLSKKQVSDTDNTLQLVFGYTCRGFHPLFNSQQQVEAVASAFESGCKEIPDGESFTFRWSSFCDDTDAVQYYGDRISKAVSPESEFLDWGQLGRIRELTRIKQRKNIALNIYTTFTIVPGGTNGGDRIDRALVKLGDFLERRFTPTGETELTKKKLTQILDKAIDVSLRHQQILSEMGFSPSPKSEKQLWQELINHVGATPTKVPHTLVFDEKGIREEFIEAPPNESQYLDRSHATSVLLNNGIPFADRQWVCLPRPNNQKKYVGVMTLTEKPEAFASTRAQTQFLWNIFSRDIIYDIEVITQISKADPKLIRLAQQMITRRARQSEISLKNKTVDVASQINTEWSVNAQRQLYTGDIPENIALVVLLYRNTPEEVEDACRLINGYINKPAELTREIEYAWLVWLQTLLLKQEKILVRPYNRRQIFFSSEVLGMTNAIQVAASDAKGFELIADEGHSPVRIDLSKIKNIMVLATTRAGKSVLIAAIIADCMAQGMPVTMIDLPNDDGTGTFGDYTPYFGGFYFDISRESNNLLQPPDLSNVIDSEIREHRIDLFKKDVITVVEQLVIGSYKLDGFDAPIVESLITLGVTAFYNDAEIQRRFQEAQEQGIGTEVWNNTPVLKDLENFFTPEHIALGKDNKKALNFIKLRLEGWRKSSIGNAIARPSTFHSNAKLITFALTNLTTSKEAEVLGMSAYLAASRQAFSTLNSVFFMDEASVLLRFNALSRLMGRKCATAGKSGCRVMVAAQDIVSVAQSEAGVQIVENMPCRLIGRILPGAAENFHKHLKIPLSIIEKNESFQLNAQQIYTLWLLHYNNVFIRCRYYPSYPLLGLVANNREEQAARDRFKKLYPDKFQSLSEFSKYYVECIKQGKSL